MNGKLTQNPAKKFRMEEVYKEDDEITRSQEITESDQLTLSLQIEDVTSLFKKLLFSSMSSENFLDLMKALGKNSKYCQSNVLEKTVLQAYDKQDTLLILFLMEFIGSNAIHWKQIDEGYNSSLIIETIIQYHDLDIPVPTDLFRQTTIHLILFTNWSLSPQTANFIISYLLSFVDFDRDSDGLTAIAHILNKPSNCISSDLLNVIYQSSIIHYCSNSFCSTLLALSFRLMHDSIIDVDPLVNLMENIICNQLYSGNECLFLVVEYLLKQRRIFPTFIESPVYELFYNHDYKNLEYDLKRVYTRFILTAICYYDEYVNENRKEGIVEWMIDFIKEIIENGEECYDIYTTLRALEFVLTHQVQYEDIISFELLNSIADFYSENFDDNHYDYEIVGIINHVKSIISDLSNTK